jgi:Tfp pilus assembly protein PilV
MKTTSGLSLLEMLVATTLLVIIVLGLTAMFLQTQKAFKSGTTQTDVMESGRTVIDMMSRDFAQMSDAQDSTITNFFYGSYTSSLLQTDTQGNSRQNVLSDVFTLQHINNTWYGVGYTISNVIGTKASPLVGTLCRYVYQTNDTPRDNPCYFFTTNVQNFLFGPSYYRVIDGVINLSVRAFDANGLEIVNSNSSVLWMPDSVVSDRQLVPSLTNNIPNSVELELGILEPQVLEQARALPSPALQQAFLSTRMSAVHIFRQQIPVRVALPR